MLVFYQQMSPQKAVRFFDIVFSEKKNICKLIPNYSLNCIEKAGRESLQEQLEQ